MFVESIVFSSGMLLNVVFLFLFDYNYVQWQEREEDSYIEQFFLMKKIILVFKFKGFGELDLLIFSYFFILSILSKVLNEELLFVFFQVFMIDFVNLNLIYSYIGKKFLGYF